MHTAPNERQFVHCPFGLVPLSPETSLRSERKVIWNGQTFYFQLLGEHFWREQRRRDTYFSSDGIHPVIRVEIINEMTDEIQTHTCALQTAFLPACAYVLLPFCS